MKKCYDRRWEAFRARFLRHPDHQRCRSCNRSIWSSRDRNGKLLPPHLDHITPLNAGGAKYDPANLQPLCHTCHSQKTRSEQTGRTLPGCTPDGYPRDPNHPWRKPPN